MGLLLEYERGEKPWHVYRCSFHMDSSLLGKYVRVHYFIAPDAEAAQNMANNLHNGSPDGAANGTVELVCGDCWVSDEYAVKEGEQ